MVTFMIVDELHCDREKCSRDEVVVEMRLTIGDESDRRVRSKGFDEDVESKGDVIERISRAASGVLGWISCGYRSSLTLSRMERWCRGLTTAMRRPGIKSRDMV